jgi:hypothetical protein
MIWSLPIPWNCAESAIPCRAETADAAEGAVATVGCADTVCACWAASCSAVDICTQRKSCFTVEAGRTRRGCRDWGGDAGDWAARGTGMDVVTRRGVQGV